MRDSESQLLGGLGETPEDFCSSTRLNRTIKQSVLLLPFSEMILTANLWEGWERHQKSLAAALG